MENKFKLKMSSTEDELYISDQLEVYRNDPAAGQLLFDFVIGFLARSGYTLATKEAQNGSEAGSKADEGAGAEEPGA
jgi:hypothetical protein